MMEEAKIVGYNRAPLVVQCMYEVRRLEEAKVAQMVDLVRDKEQELLALCAATHIDAPEGLARYVEEISREGTIPQPGAVADLLAKLVRMLTEVQVSFRKAFSGPDWFARAGGGDPRRLWIAESPCSDTGKEACGIRHETLHA